MEEQVQMGHMVFRIIGVVSCAICIGAQSVQASDEVEWKGNDASIGTSDSMENHEADSTDPEDLLTESESLDSHMGHSESLDSHLGHSENPDDLVVETESLDAHMGDSQSFSDLPTATPDEGFEEIEPAGGETWPASTDPEVILARRKLDRAEERAKRARTIYGDMMNANYPRGDARIRIVKERDDSLEALELARDDLEKVDHSYERKDF